jgi:hypothetical protein
MLIVGNKIPREEMTHDGGCNMILDRTAAIAQIASACPEALANWENDEAIVVQVPGPRVWVILKWGDGENFTLSQINQTE